MQNQSLPTSVKTFFGSMNVLFYALLAGQLIFFVVAFQLKGTTAGEMPEQMKLIISLMVISFIVISPIFYVWFVKTKAPPGLPLAKRLSIYRNGNIVRWAILEGGCLISLVFFLVTADMFYVYLFLACFTAFLITRPTYAKCIADLKLEGEDRKIIENNLPIE